MRIIGLLFIVCVLVGLVSGENTIEYPTSKEFQMLKDQGIMSREEIIAYCEKHGYEHPRR